MKRLTTFLMALMLTWIGAKAQIADGSYMVVNTETGQFLYGSYNWGSRASLGSKPVFFTVSSVGDNTYHLADTQWDGEHYLYLTSDNQYYCDGGTSTNYTLTIVADGDGYTISYGSYYVYASEGKNNYVTSTTDASQASHFKFVSLQDVIDSMEGASSSNPVDVTALINDANFKPGGNGLTAKNDWVVSATTSGSNTVTIGSYDGNNHITVACCAETYHTASYSISQTITLPKAGYYNLSAQGFYRDDNTSRTDEITAQMFAGEQTVDLNARQTEANTMAAAWGVFLEGSEPVPSITIYAEEADENVSIGFSGGDESAWVIFGELELEYLGETLEYAIGEPECTTAYVQPGGELTITFPNCVTPNTNEEPELSTTAGSITVNGTEVTDAVLTSTGLTSTVTFTVPTTLAQGAEVTVIVPAGLVTWLGTEVSSPAQDVTFTLHTPAIADQMGVYLLNTNTSEYLSRGYNWGTRADVDYYGIPVDIVADEDGLYTIQYVDNSGYLGDTGWAYGDCGTDRWVHYTIESYNADGVTGYRFKCEEASTDGTDRYLYLNENNTENDDVNEPLVANNGLLNDNYTVESQAVWQIHDETAHTAQKAAFVASQKAAIAALVGEEDLDTYIASQTATDVTAFVEDPSFDSAEISGTSGWIGSYTHTENANNGSFSSGGTTSGFESWNGCIQLQQTITDLPSGVYKIDLKGFFRQATNIICYTYKDYDMSTAFIDANGYEINLAPWASEASINEGATGSAATDYSPNSKADSYTACATGYANELYTYVGEDGTLVITIDNQGYAFDEWMYLREMSLTYFGELEDIDSDYQPGDVVTVDGYECIIVDENEISNHSFELGFEGWTVASDFTTTISEDFELRGGEEDLAKTGNKYLVGTSTSQSASVAGSSGTSSLGTAWPIEPGKTYLFTYWIKNLDGTEDSSWLKTSLTNTSGDETEILGYPETVDSDWQKVQYLFTNGEEDAEDCYAYLQIKFRWLAAHWGFDNFSLHEVEATELEYNNDVTWALANPSFETDKVANLTEDATRCTPEGGTYTGGAYTIGNGLTGWTLSVSSSGNVASDLMTEACQRTDNNFGAPGTPTDGTQMLYLHDNSSATSYVEQTITLPAGEYKLTVDSKCVSTGSSTAVLVAGGKSTSLDIHSSYVSGEEALDWDTAELKFSLDATTDVTVGVDISYTGNGSFLLDNFKLYSVDEIEEEITWTMTPANWGTLILPFDVASIPEELTLYAGDALTIDDSTITVGEAATSIAANTAYIVKSDVEVEKDTDYTFSGTPVNETEIYTTGVLTGTLVDLAVAKGAAFATDGTQYLLQNQEEVDGVAFYPIVATESAEATLDAYHCYLTVTTEDTGDGTTPAKLSIVLPVAGEETGIVAVESDVIANDAIYDLSGRRVSKAVKGVYIQNGKKVLVK